MFGQCRMAIKIRAAKGDHIKNVDGVYSLVEKGSLSRVVGNEREALPRLSRESVGNFKLIWPRVSKDVCVGGLPRTPHSSTTLRFLPLRTV